MVDSGGGRHGRHHVVQLRQPDAVGGRRRGGVLVLLELVLLELVEVGGGGRRVGERRVGGDRGSVIGRVDGRRGRVRLEVVVVEVVGRRGATRRSRRLAGRRRSGAVGGGRGVWADGGVAVRLLVVEGLLGGRQRWGGGRLEAQLRLLVWWRLRLVAQQNVLQDRGGRGRDATAPAQWLVARLRPVALVVGRTAQRRRPAVGARGLHDDGDRVR